MCSDDELKWNGVNSFKMGKSLRTWILQKQTRKYLLHYIKLNNHRFGNIILFYTVLSLLKLRQCTCKISINSSHPGLYAVDGGGGPEALTCHWCIRAEDDKATAQSRVL